MSLAGSAAKFVPHTTYTFAESGEIRGSWFSGFSCSFKGLKTKRVTDCLPGSDQGLMPSWERSHAGISSETGGQRVRRGVGVGDEQDQDIQNRCLIPKLCLVWKSQF